MKKVVIFNGYYYPSKNCGGPITSIENIVNACSSEFDFYIVCYNHDFGDMSEFENVEVNKWTRIGNANVMYVRQNYLDFSKANMKAFLQSLKPDLIWFSGVLTPNNKLVAVKIANKMGIPVLFSPRGEVSADRVKIKAYKKIPYLYVLKLLGKYKGCYFHATSDDEEEGIIKYFRPDQDHLYKVANISILQQSDVVEHKKEKGELKVFFFSRIHEVKNVLFAIQCINKCKANVTFHIYGPIESKDYWGLCEEEIRKSPQNIRIEYKGIIGKEEMSSILQRYDCFLFPTINENYGHVIAESLANSRPVILSRGTTPWDDLDGVAGYAIDLQSSEKFTQVLDMYANKSNEEFDLIIQNTKEYFNSKLEKDAAVAGHVSMIKSIIQ